MSKFKFPVISNLSMFFFYGFLLYFHADEINIPLCFLLLLFHFIVLF